jgi:APA family basic amino acid/polyamine antiporter
VLSVTVLYILTSAAFIYLVPMERVPSGETSSEIFAAQAGEALFGRFGGQVFSGVVVVTVLGSLAGLIMAAPRVYYAMARDRVFFPAVARLHPRFGTPARAIAIQAALASMLVLLGNFKQIVGYFVFVVVFFLALTVAALFRFRRAQSKPGGDYLTPGYPLTPIFFILLIALLLVLLALNYPKEALLGTAVVGAGLPIYYLFFRRRQDF